MKNKGTKRDEGKTEWGLLDKGALEEMVRVLMYGAGKYGKFDWRLGVDYSRLYNAAFRHLWAFVDGADLDAESGLSHLAHAQCCLMFLQWMVKNRRDLDDRSGEGGKKEGIWGNTWESNKNENMILIGGEDGEKKKKI